MIEVPDEALGSFYLIVRLGYVALFALWAGLLFRFPRPSILASGTVFFGLCVYLAIQAPLRRPWALAPGSDRIYNVAMASTAATGGSPFESYQVGFGDHEPLWRMLMAGLSLGDPENVLKIYSFLTPAVIALLALSLYFASTVNGTTRETDSLHPKWEPAFIVYAVLLLNSSPHERFVVFEPFWPMTLLLKPNHVLGFVMLPLWVSAFASRRPWVRTVGASVLLALLSWVFLLHWSYVLVGLFVFPWIATKLGRPGETKQAWLTGALSVVIAVPYIWFLFVNFPPGESVVGEHIWESTYAFREGYLDVFGVGYQHGFLFLLSLLGIWAMFRRRSPTDVVWLSLLAGAVLSWAAFLVAFQMRRIIEPEEFYFYTRFLLCVAAGSGAFFLVCRTERLSAWLGKPLPSIPHGLCLLLVLTLPSSFPYWWNPPKMDRYFPASRSPIPEHVERLTAWVRTSTDPDAVFLASPRNASWIAALSGRRVLLTGNFRPPNDYERRQDLVSRLLGESAPETFREAYELYRVTHLALDRDFVSSFDTELTRFESLPWLSAVYRDDSVTVFEMQRR